ncbi:hypothetical protein GDO86_015833 [Hymenochirus boettgeri]|uniref:Uncharacterized protein n=1 Tax=Hymenochirus boettgeri TaxID=247094 RepID=A0A8T2JZG7_9PIPI|nr:hypothetical protein GDO86_015833 [Hymenochirus boettgeri]
MKTSITLAILIILLVAVTGHPHRRLCHMAKYRSIPSNSIKAVRLLQNEHEKNPFCEGIKCYRKMFRHKPSVCDLKGSDKLILTLERVSMAAEVLTNLTNSPLTELVSQTIPFLLSLENDLKLCRNSPKNGNPPTQKLIPWLTHLKHFQEEVSLECVQDAVLLSLTRLLIEDVMCWANNE